MSRAKAFVRPQTTPRRLGGRRRRVSSGALAVARYLRLSLVAAARPHAIGLDEPAQPHRGGRGAVHTECRH